MSWDTVLVERLRFLIGDTGTDPADQTYSDVELAKFIAISAIHVMSSISYKGTFSIDTSVPTIDPDPISDDIPIGIGNMFVLKAACIIAQSERKKNLSKYGIKVVDHRTTVDTTKAGENAKDVTKSFCDMYEDAAEDWVRGIAEAGARFITGPIGNIRGVYHKGRSTDTGGFLSDY
jgi:hypothetical protein